MATVNTNDLRIQNAKNFKNSLVTDDLDKSSYVFVGRVQPWADENAPPIPQNNYNTFFDVYNNMFTMRELVTPNMQFMIPRFQWVSGITYDYYRQDYTSINRAFSGAENLYECLWIVRNQQNNVYVCLDNNNNGISTIQPQNTSNEPFTTTDGYQWQRVFNYTTEFFSTYKTDNFMPIQDNDVVVTTEGALSTVIVENPGASFTNNPIGAPNNIPFYYCAIDGNGTGAVAKVYVDQGSVTQVEVVRAGSGYSYAVLDFTANNCYDSLSDFDRKANPLNPLGDGTLRTTVIIPPPGGWGTDLQRELGGTMVGVFSNLDYEAFKPIQASFRQVGIMQDAEKSVTNENLSACYAVIVEALPTGSTYISGETIEQNVVDADDEEIIHRALGIVISYDSDTRILRYTQNSNTVDIDGVQYAFSGTNPIEGLTSELSTKPDPVTEVKEDLSFVVGYAVPQVKLYTGLLSYIANVSPVVKDPDQTERVSLLIAF